LNGQAFSIKGDHQLLPKRPWGEPLSNTSVNEDKNSTKILEMILKTWTEGRMIQIRLIILQIQVTIL